MDGLTRPTHVDRKTYIAFGNKCREEDKSVRDVLNGLLQLYNKGKVKVKI